MIMNSVTLLGLGKFTQTCFRNKIVTLMRLAKLSQTCFRNISVNSHESELSGKETGATNTFSPSRVMCGLDPPAKGGRR